MNLHAKPLVPRWLARLPNQLTLLRVACIPLVLIFMTQGQSPEHAGASIVPENADILAALIFTGAALTDFFDGWIARRYGVVTLFGKLMDPLADKLLVVSSLIILVEKHRLQGWLAVTLIVRDLAINAIRIGGIEDGVSIPSSFLGKIKTALTDIAIVGLTIGGSYFGIPFHFIGHIFMWVALGASLVSAVQYMVSYARQVSASR